MDARKKEVIKLKEKIFGIAATIKPDLPQTKIDELPYEENEIQIFVNYDICNFTRYKTEHTNWLDLLQDFIEFASDRKAEFPPACSLKFWKFSGDAITFRQSVTSIFEIGNAIDAADKLLKRIQEVLNKNNSSIHSNVFVKAAIWLATFSKNNSNNISLSKSEFGEEFVGKNMDEGFRLASCSKPGILVVDPKIVYLLSVYADLFSDSSEIKKEREIENSHILTLFRYIEDGNDWKKLIDILRDKVEQSQEAVLKEDYSKFLILLKKITSNLYFVNYEHCKGIWSEREYPIYWYVNNIDERRFVYDEVVNNKPFRNHKLYTLSYCDEAQRDTYNRDFEKEKAYLAVIFEQVKITGFIYDLLKQLLFIPRTSTDYKIFKTANLYYMVANVVKSKGTDLGVLIFKRREERRIHLKNVWDLLPVKHTQLVGKNLKEYIESWMANLINNHNIKFNVVADEKRDSIIPVSLCNIYRNHMVNNGILCVSEIDIGNQNESEFLDEIKSELDNTGYCDVKLVSIDNIGCNEDVDYIYIDNLIIRSLTSKEVIDDSYNVSINPKMVPNFEQLKNENEFGIAYLSLSIKQILEGRNKGLYSIS